VPIFVTLPGSKSSQIVGIWVQPAQTVHTTTTATAKYTKFTTDYTLAGPLTAGVALDTVQSNATGATYTISTRSGTDALGHTAASADFEVDATTGAVTVCHPFAAGTFTVTIMATDATGTPALTPEYITLTLTVS
jgi:hypothetical protein